MKNFSVFLSKAICLIACVFFGVILYNVWGQEQYLIQYQSKAELFGYIVLGVILSVIGLCIIMFLLKKKIYMYKYSWFVIGIIIFVIQCAYVFSIKMVPIWDSRNIINEAARMLTDEVPHISSVNGYFEMYGNNYCVVLLLYFYYRILGLFHISHLWEATLFLNIVLVDCSIILFTYLLRKIKDEKIAYTFLLLCLFNPYTYVYCTYVYTTTFSMAAIPFLLFLIYCIISKSKKKKIAYSIALGVCSLILFKLRATNFIVLLAFLIIFVLYYLYVYKSKKINIKKFVVLFAIWCVSFLVSNMGYQLIEKHYVAQEIKENNFPITHWVMMANSNGGNGMYSEPDEQYTASFASKDEKQEKNIEELKIRLQSFLVYELFHHFKEKIAINWSQSITYITEIMKTNQTYSNAYRFLSGKDNAVFVIYFQISLSLIYLLAMLRAIRNLFSKNIDFANLDLMLILIGAIIFYLIWEVSPSYNICFVPLVIVLASEEVYITIHKKYKALPLLYSIGIGSIMLFENRTAVEHTIQTYDNYSIVSVYRRPSLELQVNNVSKENKILEQNFKINKNKKFNKIAILVNSELQNINTEYLFTLYDNDGNIIHKQNVKPDSKRIGEYYYIIDIPNKYGEGIYNFSIKGIGEEDSLEFIYTKQEIVDSNPYGALSIDDNNEEGKLDLIFNVYEE